MILRVASVTAILVLEQGPAVNASQDSSASLQEGAPYVTAPYILSQMNAMTLDSANVQWELVG